MLGYDPIIVLPLLLLVSVFAAFFVLGFHFILVVTSQTCRVCARAFTTEAALELHEKTHKTTAPRLPEALKAA